MQSPEQPQKALPQPPHPKTDPQPTIAQSTNRVPATHLPPTPQKATLQTSTQPAVEENKTTETTSTSHSDTKKTTTSFLKKIKSKFSSGGNKPIETDTISQDSELTPTTQDTQNKLEDLLKKLDSLPESEEATELVNYLKAARNSGFEEIAKATLTYVTNELEKIPTKETPKINNHENPIEMIKKQSNTRFFNDLEGKTSLLNPEDDNFYESYLEIVEKMQDWLEDNIAQDDKNYDNIKKEIDNVLRKNTNDEKLKALRKAFNIPNEQNLDQG